MRKIYSTLLLLALLPFAMLGQNGWYEQATIATSNQMITSIDFSSINNGVLTANFGSNGYVYMTTNGGQSWTQDTMFAANLNQVIINGSDYYAVGSSGKAYKKTGSGSWSLMTTSSTANLNDVFFVNSTTGFIVGDGGVLLKTTNGGTNWTNPILSGGQNYDYNAIYFTSTNNGVIVGDFNFFQGFAMQTVSGGTYWGLPSTMPSKLNAVDFTSATTGYAVGNGGVIYKTTNSGAGWTLKTSGVSVQLWDVAFVNDTVGYVVGDNGTILKTMDAGTSWSAQPVNFAGSYQALSAISASTAWTAGDSSKVFHTTTGGVNLTVSVNDTSVYCNGYAQLNAITSYNGQGTLSYSWASNPLLSDTAIANPIAGPISQSETFYLTVSDGSLSATDSVTISMATLPADSICLVSVLDSLNHNVVVFEKHVAGPIEYYNIYKETTVANVYDSIGFIPADSAGIFVDTAANPAVQAYRYKISSVDSCGNETAMSNHHKTIHLTINQGLPGTWNLIWNNYEGVFINTYRIWRGDSVQNMMLLDSVAGNMTSYTDTAPPPNQVFYQIEIISSYVCQPYNYKAQTNYNTSRSNKAQTGAPPTISADFNATPATGTAPLQVQFNDASMGNIDTYIWDFGDGDTAMVKNPMHTYTTPGIYDVKLYIKSGMLEDSIVKNAFIDVVSSIEDIDLEKKLKIYPNPASQDASLTIELGGATIQSIELFDLVGKQVRAEFDINQTKTNFRLNAKSKGLYFIKITTVGGNTVQRKLVVK
jgi:photosystem II stability/assembly factor-like uncharacterized protein/PKD repeat protein